MANNIIVPVPTELKDIKSELIFGLTKRQLIGFGATGLVVIPSFLLFKNVDLNLAMYLSFFIGTPILFMTMYKKDKMYAETWFKLWLESNVLYKEKRAYKLTKKNREVAIARGLIKDVTKTKPVSSRKEGIERKEKRKQNEVNAG